MDDLPAPSPVKARFEEMFEASHRVGLVELTETDVRMTPDGAACLGELLSYLQFHPRADIRKRSQRLADALFGARDE